MPNYCVLRIEKLKSNGAVTSSGAHCLRTRPTPNADASALSPEIIIGSGKFLNDLTKCYNEAGIRKRRKNGVLALEMIMGASANFFRPDDALKYGHYNHEIVVKFNAHAIAWVKEEFGEKNIVGAVCHLDEGTPHLHVLIAPLDATPTPAGKTRIRANAKRWTGGRGKMRGLQTSFARKMESLGLVRGIASKRASHQKVKKHYGALYADVSLVPPPKVDAPPASIRKSSREQWASLESKRLAAEQKEAVERLIVQAQLGVHAQHRADDMAATASHSQQEHRAMAERLRDIKLDLVINDLGLIRSKDDRHKWKGPGLVITVTAQKFYDHHNNRGGGGAIDLVMHCLDDDYLQALAWLADRYGDRAAEGSVASLAESYVVTAKKTCKPYSPPVQSTVAADWNRVRMYLIEKRALNSSAVDYLHNNGMIYASKSRGHTNCVFKTVRGNCAEIIGVGQKKYKGLAPGSSPSSGGFRIVRNKNKTEVRGMPLVLVESAVEVISFFEICGSDCDIISTCGCRPDAEFIHEAILKKRMVVVGYNNDEPGEKAYRKLLDNYKNNAEFINKQFPPQGYNDWNDYLVAMKCENNAAEKSEKNTEEIIETMHASREDVSSSFCPMPW